MRVWFKRAFLLAFVAALGFGTYRLLTSPYFFVNDVRVFLLGDVANTYLFAPIEKSLKPELSASLNNQSLWLLDLDNFRKEIKKDQRVLDVEVVKRFPKTVIFRIEPRRPVGLLLGKKGELFPIGADGELLPMLDQGLVPELPIVRGLEFFKNKSLRKRLVTDLMIFPEHGLFSRANISELHRRGRGEYEIHLNEPAAYINISLNDFKYKVSMVIRVLEYLKRHNLKGRVIDARFSKKVVVRLRNQP